MNVPSRPHLLHIFNTFDPGGAQTRLVALANHFGPSLRHTIIAMDGRFGCVEQFNPNVDHALHSLEVQKGTLTGNLARFRSVLSHLRPDRLITHNWGTIEWAAVNWPGLARHIHIEDGFGPDETNRQLFRRVLARRALLRKSQIVVPSLTLAKIAERDWHIAISRLRFIPNGIDCKRFAKREQGKGKKRDTMTEWRGQGAVIGTVAAIRAEKNLPRLLRAFTKVVEKVPCRLVVIGDGSEVGYLKTLASQLGVQDSVTFAGHVVDPSALYGLFDIFALTSDTEQMPYTVLEAMAAGCPIVATDVGDVLQMVAPQNRPFIVAREDEAISRALTELLGNPDIQQSVGNANARRVETVYDQHTMFRAFAELYQLPGLVV